MVWHVVLLGERVLGVLVQPRDVDLLVGDGFEGVHERGRLGRVIYLLDSLLQIPLLWLEGRQPATKLQVYERLDQIIL